MKKSDFIDLMVKEGFKIWSDSETQLVLKSNDDGIIYVSNTKVYGVNTEHATITPTILSYIHDYISTPLHERENKVKEMTIREISEALGYKIKIKGENCYD